jgi:ureidoacrylate peracid hydrolase
VHDPFYELVPAPPTPPWVAGKVALITIDLQYLDAHPDGWMGRLARAQGKEELLRPRFEAIAAILPNVRRLQDAFRSAGQEVLHARVAYGTRDGRETGNAERMLRPDYDAPGFPSVPREPRDDELLPEVAETSDELVFSKTSSSVFNSTDIDGVLRRMGIEQLVFTGIVTESCVELSARDAADRGYAVTIVSDGCAPGAPENHQDALSRLTDGGFITSKTTDELVAAVERLSGVDVIPVTAKPGT